MHGVGDGVESESNVSPEMGKLLTDDGSRYRHSPPARGTHVRQLRLGCPHDLVLRNAGSGAPPTPQPAHILPPTTPRRPACRPGSRDGCCRHRCFGFRAQKQTPCSKTSAKITRSTGRLIKSFEEVAKNETNRWLMIRARGNVDLSVSVSCSVVAAPFMGLPRTRHVIVFTVSCST